MVVLAVLAMVFSASFTFADDVEVDVSNESVNNVNATGGNAINNQDQAMEQWQKTSSCATGGQGGAGGKGGEGGDAKATVGNTTATVGNVTGGSVGNTTADADASANIGDTTAKSETTVKGVEGDQSIENKNIYVAPENKRGHINAPTGPSGSFLNAIVSPPSKEWEMYICDPFLKTLTKKQLEIMSKEAGGFFSSGISKSLMVEKADEFDDSPLFRLDFMPEPTAQYLGEFRYESDDPIAWGAVLGHALLAAKKDVNAKRVVVWKKVYTNPSASGLSIGSGAAGSLLGGKDGDAAAGAVGLGGLIGKTSAKNEEVYGVLVRAFGDGPTDPPAGMEVCGLTVSAPTAEIVEEEIPPQKPACDADAIRKDIKDLEVKISNCTKWSYNNMGLRFQKAGKYIDLALCTGENGYYSEAIKDFKLAEENYQQGKDISTHQTEADKLLADVYYWWGGCIVEISGPNAAIAFAQDKEITNISNGFKK